VQCWGLPATSTPAVLAGSTAGFIDFAIGGSHVCYVLTTGQAYCWGTNTYGQIGNGATGVVTSPAAVTMFSDFVSVDTSPLTTSAGTSCGVHVDGQVSCWGSNDSAELGTASTDTFSHATPARLTTLSLVAEVALGQDHICARRLDGSVSCWGSNVYGQLGRGVMGAGVFAPSDVVLPLPATRVFVGPYTTCALLSDATLSCWGYNISGGLGDGTATSRGTPLVVPGLAAVVSASVGDQHTCVALSGGTVRCWGEGTSGRLGTGTTTDVYWATSGPTLTNAIEVHAGAQHSCARLADFSIRCWGENGSYQMGDGTITDRYSPVTPSF